MIEDLLARLAFLIVIIVGIVLMFGGVACLCAGLFIFRGVARVLFIIGGLLAAGSGYTISKS